jgi:hypothetical protein
LFRGVFILAGSSSDAGICGSTTIFGRANIARQLKRYNAVAISNSDVCRTLEQLDLNRLPTSQRYRRRDRRWRPYEKPSRGLRVQIDVKFDDLPVRAGTSSPRATEPVAVAVGTTGTKLVQRRERDFYEFTAIDDCTRLVVRRI